MLPLVSSGIRQAKWHISAGLSWWGFYIQEINCQLNASPLQLASDGRQVSRISWSIITTAGDRLERPNIDVWHEAFIHHGSHCCLLIMRGLNYWADLIHGKLPLAFLGRANVIRNKCLNYNFVLSPSLSHCASLLGKKRQGRRLNCMLTGFAWQWQVFRGSKTVCHQRTSTKKDVKTVECSTFEKEKAHLKVWQDQTLYYTPLFTPQNSQTKNMNFSDCNWI